MTSHALDFIHAIYVTIYRLNYNTSRQRRDILILLQVIPLNKVFIIIITTILIMNKYACNGNRIVWNEIRDIVAIYGGKTK